MPRIRTVKPDQFTDPAFADLSRDARLLVLGARCFMTDHGVIADSPRQLQLQVFPGDPTGGITSLIDEVVASGLWVRATAPNGDAVLVEPDFRAVGSPGGQRIDRPTADPRWGDPATWVPPILPRFVDDGEPLDDPDTRGTLDERSCGKGREGKKESRGASPRDVPAAVPDDGPPPAAVDVGVVRAVVPRAPKPEERWEALFDEWWALYPRKLARKAALKAWLATFRAAARANRGAPTPLPFNAARFAAHLAASLDVWARYWAAEDTEGRFIPHASTWLNQERWKERPDAGPVGKSRNTGPRPDPITGANLAPGVG